MSRPPSSLTDDQARDLVQRVVPLLDRYLVDPRDHRPFLRAFIRAVHEVTNKLHGPEIYRWLLRAYAPGRNPTTPTIAIERDAFERELGAAGAAAGSLPSSPLPQGSERTIFAPHEQIVDSCCALGTVIGKTELGGW